MGTDKIFYPRNLCNPSLNLHLIYYCDKKLDAVAGN
jgi:hypothetical protein